MPDASPTRPGGHLDRWDLLLAVLASMVVCWAHLHPFVDDARPSHFDEWRNAGRMQHLRSAGELDLPTAASGFADLDEDIAHRNLQSGYVVLATTAARLLRFDLVTGHKALALLGLLVLAAGVWVLTRVLAGDRTAPPIAVVLLAFIPTNINLLGPAYAVPVVPSVGAACFFLAAWVAGDSWSRRRRLMVLIGSAALLVVIYPLTAVFVFGLLVVAALVRPGLLLEPVRTLGLGAVLAALLTVLLVAGASGRDSAQPLVAWAIEQLVFINRWHLHRFYDFPLTYLTPGLVLAAAVGGCWLAWLRRAEVVALAWLLPLAAYGSYTWYGYGFGLPYQRLSLFLGGFGAVLAALSIATLARWAGRRDPRWSPVVATAALLLVTATGRSTPPGIETLERPRRPSPAVQETLEWIADQGQDPAARVHSHPAVASYLRALTGLRPSDASIDALLNGRGLAVFRCDDDYDLVIGIIRCDTYRPVFASRGVAVYEPVGD